MARPASVDYAECTYQNRDIIPVYSAASLAVRWQSHRPYTLAQVLYSNLETTLPSGAINAAGSRSLLFQMLLPKPQS